MNAKFWLPSLMLVATMVGCGSSAPTAAPVDEPLDIPPTSAVEMPSAPPATAPVQIDVEAYDACQIVPPSDVVDLLGGSLVSASEQQPGPSCVYGIDPGDGSYDNYIVYILPADMTATFFEAAQGELGDPLPGLGDEAYMDYEEATETYDLQVLVDGRFAVEVIGSTEDGTRSIAELFLSRMMGP